MDWHKAARNSQTERLGCLNTPFSAANGMKSYSCNHLLRLLESLPSWLTISCWCSMAILNFSLGGAARIQLQSFTEFKTWTSFSDLGVQGFPLDPCCWIHQENSTGSARLLSMVVPIKNQSERARNLKIEHLLIPLPQSNDWIWRLLMWRVFKVCLIILQQVARNPSPLERY